MLPSDGVATRMSLAERGMMNLASRMRATTEILNPGGTINTRFSSNGVDRSDKGTSTVVGTSARGGSVPEERTVLSGTRAATSNAPTTALDRRVDGR
jgi:hypothetical protein